MILTSIAVLNTSFVAYAVSAPLSELPQDISTKIGLWSGNITTSREVDYGLALGTFALSLPKDLSTKWERQYQLELWIDLETKQVVKQVIEANWNYCILGGTRRYRSNFRREELTRIHHSCLGTVYRMGLSFYDIPSPEVGVAPLSGRSLEGFLGLRYFRRITEKSDLGLEWTSTIFSVTASREQIRASGSGFSIAFRGLI